MDLMQSGFITGVAFSVGSANPWSIPTNANRGRKKKQ